MRKKGLNALELIFTLFVLIVVVLVVIKMFINRMNFNEVKPVEDVKESFKYSAALSKCNSLCEDYLQDKTNHNALRFCQQRVDIDIDGDGKVGQIGAYGVAFGIVLTVAGSVVTGIGSKKQREYKYRYKKAKGRLSFLFTGNSLTFRYTF